MTKKTETAKTAAEIQAEIDAQKAELDAMDEQRRAARAALRKAEKAKAQAEAREAHERDISRGLALVGELREMGVTDDEMPFVGGVIRHAREQCSTSPDGVTESAYERVMRALMARSAR